MDTVEKDLHVQKKQLQQIEQSIQAFVDLRDSFKGLGGQSIRQFFEWYHLSFLKQLLSFYEEYKETLSQIKTNLQALEPDNNGYIKESFLENELANGLKKIKETTISLTDEANDIMLGVADIVSLPMLDDSYVLQGIVKAEEKRDITVGQLHMFDQQQTTALQSLEYTVQAMIKYIQLGSTLFQSKSGSVQTVDSIFYNQAVYQPPLSFYTYSSATLNQLSTWDNFYLNYLKNNSTPTVAPLISDREAEALMRHAKDSVEVIDEYNDIHEVSAISEHYYTLGDGKILRQYYDATGVYKYEYVESIPADQTGGEQEVGSEVVSFVLDFIPILSNIKAAIEAYNGEDLITGREIGNVERAILVAAILGGPIVKGARVLGKTAMKQLPKVKNVFNPEKAKSLAKDFYDDYINKGIQKGSSAVSHLVKKVADMPMPFSPSLATANGMAFTKTIGETMKEAKETIVQMAGKVKGNVSGKNSKIEKLTEEQLSTKPPYSRNPEKWQKKGGKIEIDEDGTWTYIDWEVPPNKVSYPGGFPDFKSSGLVRQEVSIGEFNRYDIDFTKADELAPNGPKLDENTWHHHQDLTTMQEVNKEVHRRFRHRGGMSIAKKSKD